MKTLTVISPVFEEEEVIETFYLELRAVLNSLADRYDASILFVVDRGRDATLDILRRIALADRSVRALAMSARFGHQMALVAGMDYSDSDVVIMMDSDLQHPPALIPDLLREYERGHDIVYTLRQDTPEIGLLKRMTSQLFYRFANKLSDVPISESAADFRLLSRRVVEVFQTQIRERNLFLRGFIGWIGFNSTAVPFRVRHRPSGRSKYSLARLVRFALQGTISFSKKPLQSAAIFGFCFAGMGFLFAIITTIQFLLSGRFPSGWTTIVVLISIFSGIQLLFLGILGEYIGAIFDEVKARPHYIVQDMINFDGQPNLSRAIGVLDPRLAEQPEPSRISQ